MARALPRALPVLLLAASTAVLLCGAAPAPGPSDRSPLMVKILDAVKGVPAASVALRVHQRGPSGEWRRIADGVTDETGETRGLLTEQNFPAGVYRVEFDTKAYWTGQNMKPFHEVADVVFEAHAEGHRHYTLALLLSPSSYITTAVVMDVPH